MSKSSTITSLIAEYRGGDAQALEALLPLVYDQLRRIARRHMSGERRNHTLQPTALVNEAFIQLMGRDKVTWENRAHFFSAAAQMMRWILLDHAKKNRAEKRGGGAIKVSFEENLHWIPEEGVDLQLVDRALEKLATLDERKAKVVELRFFGGLGIEETAEALGIGVNTVKRDWNFAKTWLYREISKDGQP